MESGLVYCNVGVMIDAEIILVVMRLNIACKLSLPMSRPTTNLYLDSADERAVAASRVEVSTRVVMSPLNGNG